MNKVLLIGNLTRDPELTQTANGVALCKMSIAVNRPYTSASGERETDFFNVTAWRGLAENCNKYLKKGSKIGLVGTIQMRTYESDGVKKYFTDIIADEIEFLSPKGDNSSGGGSNDYEKKSIRDNPPIEDDSLPF